MPPRAPRAEPASIPRKGRGVRALEPIPAGAEIEAAPTVPLSAADCDLVERTPIGDYYFAHPEDPEAGLVVLGLASLCNHADDPNAEVRWQMAAGVGWLARLVALRAIAAGEEVTRRYRCPPWFDVAP